MKSDNLKTKVYNQEGSVVGEQVLNEKIFGLEVKPEVVQQALVAQMANARVNIAKAKTRKDVNGGGHKPWNQKGTGRARQGSTRSPLWKGGGVVFGPTGESNFSKDINKKVKTKALFMCLSDKLQNDKVVLLDKFEMSEIKTKKVTEVLNKLPMAGKKTLVVLAEKDEKVIKSVRNMAKAEVIKADSLNVKDLLAMDYVLMPVAALEVVDKTYLKK